MEDSYRRRLLHDIYRQRGGLPEPLPQSSPVAQSNLSAPWNILTALMDMWLMRYRQRAAQEATRE